jgi:hypothetical protein
MSAALVADAVVCGEQRLHVRPIRNKQELDEVHRITHDTFVDEGYVTPRPDGRLRHYPHLDDAQETTVFVAVVRGAIAGTISYTLDGPAGLHVDGDFPEEVRRVRAEGRRLAASWRIAVRRDVRRDRRVVLGLIEQALESAVRVGVETVLCTFNPRHERTYARLLRFERVALSAETRGLANAPAVLMRLELGRIAPRLLRSALVSEPSIPYRGA